MPPNALTAALQVLLLRTALNVIIGMDAQHGAGVTIADGKAVMTGTSLDKHQVEFVRRLWAKFIRMESDTPTKYSILAAWQEHEDTAPLFDTHADALERAAELASDVMRHPPSADISGKDPVSGLALPPPLRTPYRQRGAGDDGRRPDVMTFLAAEYHDYIAAGLMTTGFLYEHDRPAYDAMVYLANKEAGSGNSDNLAIFALHHGILAKEHLAEPPRGFARQAALLREFQTRRQLQRLRDR